MATQQVQVQIGDLKVGMFVSQLDRPWLETPFPLQGFCIVGQADIDALAPYCDYVFIDVERERWANLGLQGSVDAQSDTPAEPERAANLHQLRVGRQEYPQPVALQKELSKAEQLHRELGSAVQEWVDEARDGRAPDVKHARRLATALVKSVIRNPDAMVWLTRIRRHDEHLYQHALRAAVWAAVFGRHLGLYEDTLENLVVGVLLCDVGYSRLPVDILTADASDATSEELRRRHVEYGVEILRGMRDLHPQVFDIVACHHERHDGSGYPRRLKGERIPLLARVAAIADYFEDLLSPRDAAAALSPSEAITRIYHLRDTAFQGPLLDQFIQAVGIYPVGTLVELTSAEVGVIVSQDYERRLRPQVLLLLDQEKRALKKPRMMALDRQRLKGDDRPVRIARGLPIGAYRISLRKVHDVSFGRRWLR